MSRIGRAPITVPADVTVAVNGHEVEVKGAKGTLKKEFHPDITITMEGNVIHVARPSDDKLHRALHGLTRTLINNMIIPVNAAGFDSALFKYFFRDIQYSEELIEPDTMQFLEWIQGVDVQSLTLADEETVTTMSRIYNMLGDGQKAFLSEYEDKFAQVLAKMNELTGNTGDDDEVPDTDGDEDDQTPPESGDNTSLIVIVCCSAGAVVLIAAAVVAVLVVRRKKASAKAQTSAEGGAHTQTDNSDREDGENE